jgi:hypothetical protein
MKCDICKKKVAECGPEQDESKFCPGHTRWEREKHEREKGK